MPTDNARHLTRAAHARAEQTRRRAVAALRQLTNSNQALTVAAVAQQASVSRSWLYTQPDLLHQIREHRPQTAALVTVPRRQAATDASLKQRLQLAHLPKGLGQARWVTRWKPALNAFAVIFADRMPAAENL
jgi:hypothetical protein